MRQAQRKKEKDKIAIALMLAFCVIALTSIFTIKSNIEKISGSGGEIPVSDKTSTESAVQKVPETTDKTPSASEDTADAGDLSLTAADVPVIDSITESKPAQTSGFRNPVRSDEAFVTNEYSMDALIYSVTLDQYMTHCGIDIEAPEDTQVVACGAGTVTAIYDDGRFGKSVEITHDDGTITIYSNLSTNEIVEVGDTVNAGTIIGGVGSSGLTESLEPAHLHLEMLKDGVYVDPADYIKFNQ
ncbi:MAG: M23 family metallopeptidase [Firmicutes bacterium]|nr:M23 family metallopeptidase [Bacillota bacterium]